MRLAALLLLALPLAAQDLHQEITILDEDYNAFRRRYNLASSEAREEALEDVLERHAEAIGAVDFSALDQNGKVDAVLAKSWIDDQARRMDEERARLDEVGELLPFAAELIALYDAHRGREESDPKASAEALDRARASVEESREKWKDVEVDRVRAHRASRSLQDLRRALDSWYRYNAGYRPLFTWWNQKPWEQLSDALAGYDKFLREEKAGAEDPDVIIGDPVGREALIADLEYQRIPYTPEELIAIAEKEFAWCDREMLRASREMGFGDDWRAALERVKTLHVPPGEQPALIIRLANEAVDFLETNELVSIPDYAKQTWRMRMMTPAEQKVSPFFLGGEQIIISYPTDEMEHDQKMMSMRGNNIHFSRATVHHELLPGHHLQQFHTRRYRPYRSLFSTPFWTEGWSLYWEMRLWDMGFAREPEDRVGFLFWRMHRCARIIFSLKFHLGEMAPQEAIDFLINRVGHEPSTAEAEVRRSFLGTYPPLYQCAYMLGALQFRALHEEVVASGKMSEREFHDRILRLGRIPVEMVRATLLDLELTRDYPTTWRFYGDPLP